MAVLYYASVAHYVLASLEHISCKFALIHPREVQKLLARSSVCRVAGKQRIHYVEHKCEFGMVSLGKMRFDLLQ